MNARTIMAALTAVLVGLFTAHSSFAQERESDVTDISRVISYQGLLSDPSGTPLVDGEYEITVTLYGNADGTTELWQGSYSTLVSRGVFNLYLGSGAHPLPPATDLDRPLWVGVSVNGLGEMSPLTPLTASPYALNIGDKAITSEKIADGAVTADKVDMDYVSEIRVNGEKVSGKGTALNLQSSGDFDVKYDQNTSSISIEKAQSATTEKGSAETQGGALDSWGMQGDGTDGANTVYVDAGDWIGTSNSGSNTNYDFTIKVNSQKIMTYQPNGTNTPNIVGGHINNTISSYTFGSIIAAGGSSSNPNEIWGSADSSTDTKYNTISGGEDNLLDFNTDYSVIGGGVNNSVLGEDYAVIGGGEDNTIDAPFSTISGGKTNFANGDYSTVGGGQENTASGSWSVIAGGDTNLIIGRYSFIGGGQSNDITSSEWSVVGGGYNNTIDNSLGTTNGGTIGGGFSNHISSGVQSTIAGGHENSISGFAGSIGGGTGNEILSSSAVIAGGNQNQIQEYTDGSFIAGGLLNDIQGNVDADTSVYSAIGGGAYNDIWEGSYHSTIAGGTVNTIQNYSYQSTISGGYNNKIRDRAERSSISGGDNNIISADAAGSTIGGGISNFIANDNIAATIPGGDHLRADGWGQTVVGVNNVQTAGAPYEYGGGESYNYDEPLFIVGNGKNSTSRSQAFEVSYSGYSTVYNRNGSGTVSPARRGATHTDNIIYAWGDVQVTLNDPLPPTINASCNYGTTNVSRISKGRYLVNLNIKKPDGTTTETLNCASITATISTGTTGATEDPYCPKTIKVSRISSNSFYVFIDRVIATVTGPSSVSIGCDPQDSSFEFQVTGRPSSQ